MSRTMALTLALVARSSGFVQPAARRHMAANFASMHDFEADALDGTPTKLSDYKGKGKIK